jgi:S1/P1 Nuclease
VGSYRGIGFALLCVVFGSVAPSAWAWGCQGHQIVALIAEKHLNSNARVMAMQILAAGPIGPDLRRYCGDSGLDAFVDSSTWADDERALRPDTAGWHFLDIPRGQPEGDIAPYCPASTSCITGAIGDQLAVLRNAGAGAQARADALRYIIHFLGDLHQPLHTTTNDDRGGNCVPVTFFGLAPGETNVVNESYAPNLHSIWDTGIVEHFANGRTPQQVADALDAQFSAQLSTWESEPTNVVAWAWQGHQLAEDAVYGALPSKVAVEKPVTVHTCADDAHISTRMLSLHEDLGANYQTVSEKIVQQQLTKAGIRLAAVLNALWPQQVPASAK